MVTIVYDNNPHRKGLAPAWGFACVVEGLDKTILFDTGGDGRLLLENMRKLEIDPRRIDAVVLSHAHGDHTGGVGGFLRARPAGARGGVPIYIAAGFPAAVKDEMLSVGGKVVEAPRSQAVCPGAMTTGTLGAEAIPEHGLCVKTGSGWVLLTGCAHPGAAEMAARATELVGEPVHLVMGGFHMGGHSAAQVKAVIDRFEALGVQRVAPCHCTGDRARGLFEEHFGDRCELAGVGSVLEFPPSP